jgi:NAD(P)-dependent dehydrogenase (short-subunit alcohol dehydrogenase family)
MAPSSRRGLLPVGGPKSLSVLVPAFNEAANLEPTIDRVLRALSITVEDYEIIVVDDGSTDETAAVADRLPARSPQIRVLHNPQNRGLGFSYLRGIEVAEKDFFVYLPGDNTWPHRSLVELFGNLGKADVVTSYSTNPGVRPFGRRIVSSLYTRTLNTLFGLRMHYYNGLTIYPLTFLRQKPITTFGFGFQAEALLRALHQGLSFVEVALPIDERTAGSSKAVTVKNIASVATTVARTYLDLRVLGRAPTAPAPVSPSEAPGPRGDEKGKPLRIVVTGASSGIGAALTRALGEDGHLLFVCARRGERLGEVARETPGAQARVCDVAEEGEVEAFVQWVKEQTPHVDALINCAGAFGAIGPIEQTASAAWFETIRVNLFGTYLMVKHTLPLMEQSGDPRVLTLSGGGAFGAFPNYSAYASSKAAIVRLTECLASELAPRGIAVNALAPGFVATDAHEATMAAGPDLAGALHYRRTEAILAEGGARMADVIACVRVLLSPATHGLTGKTISANFDPWQTEAFREWIAEITCSDLWTMRRQNIVNLPEGSLKKTLAEAWASFGTRH